MSSSFWNSKAAGYAVVGVGAAIAVYFVWKKGADAVKAVGAAVNPLSDKNLAYKGVNAVGVALTGDQSWSLGSWLYDFTHESYDPNKPVQRAPEIRKDANTLLDRLRGIF